MEKTANSPIVRETGSVAVMSVRLVVVLAASSLLACKGAQPAPRGSTPSAPVSKATGSSTRFDDQGWNERENEGETLFLRPRIPAGKGAFQQADDGENFIGSHRAVAKTTIGHASVRTLTLIELLNEFRPGQAKSDSAMRNHDPPLTEDPHCERVTEEQDNVEVEGWVIASRKETDNDFHVILSATATPGTHPDRWKFANVEVSALPPDEPERTTLARVRASFKNSFGDAVPDRVASGYTAIEPFHVRIRGSIFFDVDHLPGAVGPGEDKPMTSWEIHPVTLIEPL